jgi:hypothetical protein
MNALERCWRIRKGISTCLDPICSPYQAGPGLCTKSSGLLEEELPRHTQSTTKRRPRTTCWRSNGYSPLSAHWIRVPLTWCRQLILSPPPQPLHLRAVCLQPRLGWSLIHYSTLDAIVACRRLVRREFTPHQLPSLIEVIFSSGDGGEIACTLPGDDAQTFIDVIYEARSAFLGCRELVRWD